MFSDTLLELIVGKGCKVFQWINTLVLNKLIARQLVVSGLVGIYAGGVYEIRAINCAVKCKYW